MKAKAIKDLVQLGEEEFLVEVAGGMRLSLENASALFDDAVLIGEEGRQRAGAVLEALAEEEAAKYLILLDAVRCPHQEKKMLARQLSRFNDHLAKGIYAEYYGTRPARFGESIDFIEHHRAEYYLDGPNDVDWIFRNAVRQEREERLYVDYVSTDEGNYWLTPMTFEQRLTYMNGVEPPTLRVSRTLHEVGCSDPGALRVIAEEWRGVTFGVDDHWQVCAMRNQKTLEALQAGGLLRSTDRDVLWRMVWEWLFPLWNVDLSEIKVKREDLRERQAGWTPDWL